MFITQSTGARQVILSARRLLVARMLIRHGLISCFGTASTLRRHGQVSLSVTEVPYYLSLQILSDLYSKAMATVQSDIFKPTKFGGKYTTTLIPGTPSHYHFESG